MNYESGSIWRKWDLHVHTPYSIEQSYGGEAAWEEFLADLETLPDEFKVLGINDYIFLEGYKRLKRDKASGRLQNIDLLLPVVELRIDRLAGTDGHLSRVNYHVIFSDELTIENIEQQFINGLLVGYQLSPGFESLSHEWRSILTRESIAQLGDLIIQSTPPERRSQSEKPLSVGFRNLNFNLDQIGGSSGQSAIQAEIPHRGWKGRVGPIAMDKICCRKKDHHQRSRSSLHGGRIARAMALCQRVSGILQS
jgi:hypothetical protein